MLDLAFLKLSLEIAKEWAEELNTSIIRPLGDGACGVAYLTEKNTVIKITQKNSEYFNAFLAKENKAKESVAIFDLKAFNEECFAIHQELVNTDIEIDVVELEDIIEVTFNISLAEALESFYYGSDDELIHKLPKALTNEQDQLLKKIYENYESLTNIGICTDDVWGGNMGIAENGSLKLFDLAYLNAPFDKEYSDRMDNFISSEIELEIA